MKSIRFTIVALMLCFFSMGFVDLVGIASNYVKADLQLSDSVANIFPSLVFFWFLIFSVPTGMLMNRIGKYKTVLLSLAVTVVSLMLPLFGNGFSLMFISFSLLGIGNTIMQVSLNPLMAVVAGEKNLAAQLTFGQFVKAIASFLAPYLAMWGATQVIPSFGLGWRALFAVYFIVAIISALCLWSAEVNENKTEVNRSSFLQCLSLLKRKIVLLTFLGIMCHVGIDVGTNTTAPRIFIERLGVTLNDAAFATSLYFVFRTIGCLTGSLILRIVKSRTFFLISVALMISAMALLTVADNKLMLYTGVALVGYGNSNIFSICFANALTAMPQKQNEVSGLMIMEIGRAHV